MRFVIYRGCTRERCLKGEHHNRSIPHANVNVKRDRTSALALAVEHQMVLPNFNGQRPRPLVTRGLEVNAHGSVEVVADFQLALALVLLSLFRGLWSFRLQARQLGYALELGGASGTDG